MLQQSGRELASPPDLERAASWDYDRRGETLADFIQSITSFSNVQETGSLMERIASVARITLNGSFAVVAKRNQQGWLLRCSGRAPLVFHSLQNGAAQFLEAAIRSPYTFRMRDLRRDCRSAIIQLDSTALCSLLACPIHSNGQHSGLILVFGKQDGDAFLDSDVFLAELLASNAAMNLESCFLNQELRNNLETTQLLYSLSLDISLAENLDQAVHVIAQTALKLMQARCCGLVLVGKDGRKEAAVLFPADAPEFSHPFPLIQQAMDSQQTIYLAETDHTTRIAIPIQTPRRCYGALWMELQEGLEEDHHPAEEIRVLVNQASVALERLIFLEETRSQAKKLEAINLQLEESYHQTLKALMRALDARDSDTEGHSERVNELSDLLGSEMGLSEAEHKALLLGALLHDIGKIAVPDQILHKKGPLDPAEWEAMRKHPENGVDIIQEIHYLKDAIPVIYFHQERWDGSGYPQGRMGEQIPLLARIFAVVDVFDALTRDRPYRKANLTTAEAIEYLEKQAGAQFDPLVVERFVRIICRKMEEKAG
jgi:putative nucleotidyltransferase with HDIG domain